VSDKQAQQDALRARRAYEAYEREWRRKEKESAEKQTQQEDDLRAERFKQQRAREEAIAVEAHKMKVEFFETLDCQKQEEISLKKVDSERAVKNRSYAQEVQVIPD
jgi:Trichohyalin-plectin-homology domain